MNEHTTDIELIEKFLNGKMTVEEKVLFDDRQAKDEAFKALLSDMDMLIEGITVSAARTSKEEKLERLKFFNEIVDMEDRLAAEETVAATNDQPNRERIIPIYQKPWALATAACLALAVTVSIVWMQQRPPQNERLYATYFQTFDSPGSGLTRGANEENLKTKAYDAYDNGRYEDAIRLFNQVLTQVDDPISHLCLGNSLLAVGRYEEAEHTFDHMVENHVDLVTQARWYLALTYLKEAKMERAKATLWEISTSSTYGEKARKLLKELD